MRYFRSAQPADAAWAVYFLSGGKPRQTVPTRIMRQAALDASGLPEWLFEESYQAVGDLAETIAHILPPPSRRSSIGLAQWVEERLISLRGKEPEAIAAALRAYWDELDSAGRFLLIKLIGGGFRVGVSRLLVTRALAEVGAVDAKIVAQRMMGYTDARARPDAQRYLGLIEAAADVTDADGLAQARPAELLGQPYPFFLAHALLAPLARFDAELGSVADWQVEWKYDGIRGQLVKRAGQLWLWSRGEELVTERFPEIAALNDALPDGCVIDGEILVWDAGSESPAPFAALQTRIGRKTLGPKILREVPVVLLAYELLELDGVDLRAIPLAERRARLESLVLAHPAPALRLAPVIAAASWDELAQLRAGSRARAVEGLMLKQTTSAYGLGRTKQAGVWWKWKIDPLSVDAVLIYAQAGHGRRASLYTDYTFAVWDGPPPVETHAGTRALVPFAKAYSGLTDDEIRQVDAVIRKTTIEKFGPVRSVTPTLVFELGFEGIQRSARHRSGVAVRFPRMLRWRIDKPVAEADTLQTLQALLGEA